jgi:hypothetical protein
MTKSKKEGKKFHRKTLKNNGKGGGKWGQTFKIGMNEFFHQLEDDKQKKLIYNLYLLSMGSMDVNQVSNEKYVGFDALLEEDKNAEPVFKKFGITKDDINAADTATATATAVEQPEETDSKAKRNYSAEELTEAAKKMKDEQPDKAAMTTSRLRPADNTLSLENRKDALDKKNLEQAEKIAELEKAKEVAEKKKADDAEEAAKKEKADKDNAANKIQKAVKNFKDNKAAKKEKADQEKADAKQIHTKAESMASSFVDQGMNSAAANEVQLQKDADELSKQHKEKVAAANKEEIKRLTPALQNELEVAGKELKELKNDADSETKEKTKNKFMTMLDNAIKNEETSGNIEKGIENRFNPPSAPTEKEEKEMDELNNTIKTDLANLVKAAEEDTSKDKEDKIVRAKTIQNVLSSVFASDTKKSITGNNFNPKKVSKPAGGKRSKKHAKNHKKHKTKKNN